MIIKRIIAASTLALLSACAGPQVREEAETAAAAPPPIEEIDLYGPSPADIADEQAAIAVDQMIDAMPRSAFKSVPTPSAGFPPAQAYPPISTQSLRSSMLRLLDSIRRLEDTNREHVEAVMGVRMGKPLRTDRYFTYEGSVDDGWKYYVDVEPYVDIPASEIKFDLQPAGLVDYRITQCTFDMAPFFEEMRAAGWQISDDSDDFGSGHRFHYYRMERPEFSIVVVGRVYFSHLRNEKREIQRTCVTGLIINVGELEQAS